MNKVVALLGIIVLLTVGGLLFCVGFFTGTSLSPTGMDAASQISESDNKLTMKEVEDVMDTKSASISDKIMDMISSAAGAASYTFHQKIQNAEISRRQAELMNESQVTVDSLLREIASRHSINDECSYKDTVKKIKENKKEAEQKMYNLDGQKIVFIGYFKNRVALQIQKLLISRGYKAHIELSKTGDGHESFIFCGPFKKEAHAQALLDWLLKHDFSDARILSVTKEVKGQSLYESISEDISMPVNVEKNIEEIEKVDQKLESDENNEEVSEDSKKQQNTKNKKSKTKKVQNLNQAANSQAAQNQNVMQNAFMNNPNMGMMNINPLVQNRMMNNQNMWNTMANQNIGRR